MTETSVYAWRERFDNAELNALPAEAFDRRLGEGSGMFLAIAGPVGGGQAPRLTVSANVAAPGAVLLARLAGVGAKKMLHSAVVVRAPARRQPI